MQKTKAQALADLGTVVAEALQISRALTSEQAADRAWHPGGPSRADLTALITKNRSEIGRRSQS